MKFRMIGVGLAAALLASPAAFAQCKPESLQAAADQFFLIEYANPDLAAISAGLKRETDLCFGDAYVLKVAALGHANLSDKAKDPAAALGHMNDAFVALMKMQQVIPGNGVTRAVVNRTGGRVSIGFNDSYEVSKSLIEKLFTTEIKAGKLAAANGPPKPGDPAIKCDVYLSSTAQHAQMWISNKGDHQGAFNLLDRAFAACKPDDYNGLNIRGNRAKAILASLKRNPTAPGAVDKVLAADADSEAIFARQPEGIALGWSNFDRADLNAMMWKVLSANNASIQQADWFKPANLNKPRTNMSIAMALDAAYAQDIADANGGPNLYKTYRKIITDSYTAANALPEADKRAARSSLFFAAKQHADGTWRRYANKALRAPLSALYVWVDPDYKPPAPATPQ